MGDLLADHITNTVFGKWKEIELENEKVTTCYCLFKSKFMLGFINSYFLLFFLSGSVQFSKNLKKTYLFRKRYLGLAYMSRTSKPKLDYKGWIFFFLSNVPNSLFFYDDIFLNFSNVTKS